MAEHVPGDLPREEQIQLVTGVRNSRFNTWKWNRRWMIGARFRTIDRWQASRLLVNHTYALGPFAMWRWKRLRKRMDTALQGHE